MRHKILRYSLSYDRFEFQLQRRGAGRKARLNTFNPSLAVPGPALNYFGPRVILHCIPLAKILAQTAIVSQLIKNNVSERFEGMTFRLIDPQVM